MACFTPWMQRGAGGRRAAWSAGRALGAAALALALAAGAAAPPAAAGGYTILDLGVFSNSPPWGVVSAKAINASGQVAGRAQDNDGADAFLTPVSWGPPSLLWPSLSPGRLAP